MTEGWQTHDAHSLAGMKCFAVSRRSWWDAEAMLARLGSHTAVDSTSSLVSPGNSCDSHVNKAGTPPLSAYATLVYTLCLLLPGLQALEHSRPLSCDIQAQSSPGQC